MAATRDGSDPSSYASSTEIRTMFSQEMSRMYKLEVPLYGDLLDLISEVNQNVLSRDLALRSHLQAQGQLDRLNLERHGAIRLGSREELAIMARFLKVMGMWPVGFYDLAKAGLPVHATCFRTLDSDSLAHNPFRLFVSVLQLSLLPDDVRERTKEVVGRRQIFDDRVLQMIQQAEKDDLRLKRDQAMDFVQLGLATFRWHGLSTVSLEEYKDLDGQSPLLADIVCFRGPHINHLTPRTLDIDMVQQLMKTRGFPTKAAIEGPPRRQCPILLRQTSFKALKEQINFIQNDGSLIHGAHTARFGEVEERGAALTPKGRQLYDKIVVECQSKGLDSSNENAYKAAFAELPDDWDSLRVQGLAWFRYSVIDQANLLSRPKISQDTIDKFDQSISWLLKSGWMKFEPIVYEDFLPLSAAGIFASNLGSSKASGSGTSSANKVNNGFEVLQNMIGDRIRDEMANYAQLQQESLDACKAILTKLL
ncbi:hypothetical protein HG530_015115 [Fusarium avenaceum]|nr:hypothetical protein HG530_015115 [Fusarium avenaceum]